MTIDVMKELPEVTTVCTWCGVLLTQGRPGAKISHGVCTACRAKIEGEDK